MVYLIVISNDLLQLLMVMLYISNNIILEMNPLQSIILAIGLLMQILSWYTIPFYHKYMEDENITGARRGIDTLKNCNKVMHDTI